MVAIARSASACGVESSACHSDSNQHHDASNPSCVYLTWLANHRDEQRLRELRAHHERVIGVIDRRLGELRPACWHRRQWSDAALSFVFAAAFAAWLLLVSWCGQVVWSWLAD